MEGGQNRAPGAPPLPDVAPRTTKPVEFSREESASMLRGGDRPYPKLYTFMRVAYRTSGRAFPLLRRISSVVKPAAKKGFTRSWYQLISALDTQANVTFLNYGYAPLENTTTKLELPPEDEQNRYNIQLYYRVVDDIDLRGKDVLEVGCGRGGGAAFIARHFQPRSIIGIDFADKAIDFCNRQYHIHGLSFLKGDAEDLAFPPNSFDVVINVESSHTYHHMEQFLREVKRVLRPQGFFLFADLRRGRSIPLLREQLRASGLAVLREERITPNVVHALDLDNDRKLALIQSRTPRLLRRPIKVFAAIKGTPVYERLRIGQWEYFRFVLQKGAD